MSRRRATPRGGRRTVPGRAAVALVGLALAAVLALCAWRVMSRGAGDEPGELPDHAVTVQHDSLAPTYTYDGEIIRWYVLTGPDYGIQYLVNDRGGCTPRLDPYSQVVGVRYE